QIKDMPDLPKVVLAVEQLTQFFQIDKRTHSQLPVRLRHASSYYKTPRAHLEIGFGFSLGFLAGQRHSVDQRFLPRSKRGLEDACATRVPVELAADHRFRSLKLQLGLCADVPSADGDAGALSGGIGDYRKLAQLGPVVELDGSLARTARSRLCTECAASHPQLCVNRARAITQKCKVALIDLRQKLVAGPVHIDIRAQAVIGGYLIHHIAVAEIGEGSGAPGHPQVLKPVLGQHRDLRRLALRETGFEGGDLAVENDIVVQLNLKRFAEVEGLSVEV